MNRIEVARELVGIARELSADVSESDMRELSTLHGRASVALVDLDNFLRKLVSQKSIEHDAARNALNALGDAFDGLEEMDSVLGKTGIEI